MTNCVVHPVIQQQAYHVTLQSKFNVLKLGLLLLTVFRARVFAKSHHSFAEQVKNHLQI
jgi:hypothetical protein